MKKSFLFISCDEAKHICDKAQYDEASTWEQFKLRLRLMYCNISKKYSSNNTKLSQTIEKSKVQCLKTDELNKLQSQFDKELAKQQQD
ncbi:hypothetical protein [Winogradskyella pacifica]|jgi:N12 class adenine-specific DNA methylase|uniref:Glycine dehydrogenase n=1 Tax=Winogradskyella pacifica TaxID=664642 RepID=A0A3D9LPQ4_9FLAO|nr:hypothetical protein [Winogradskyella pacifica]REE08676.1 hypothetical protein DFQ09_106143 [Winogradskyella pacifica]|tara:strand:- start:650 stop:913 length:264 start_codon:yes stop_codon:yes gene_type:complete